MRKTLIVLGLILTAGIVTAVVMTLRQAEPTQETPQVSFPASSDSGPDSQPVEQEKISVSTWDGGIVIVNDFIRDGSTFEDPVNQGNYVIAGSLDYCSESERCITNAPDDGYIIKYFSGEQSFVIDLEDEPLSESRRKAEEYLGRVLGISQQEMCSLKYIVATTYYVNEVYGSMNNLGFSYCPGAARLP